MQYFYNAAIFTGAAGFKRGSFSVDGDRFGRIMTEDSEHTGCGSGTDLSGALVIPGLCDIHIHGNSGCDFSDGDLDGLVKMGRYLAGHGITSFAPTSMTLPYEQLHKAYQTAVKYREEQPEGAARLAGIHMEGPYFSEKKKGAQNSAYLKLPDIEGFKELYNACGGLIRIADVAPELPGALGFIREAKKLCRISVAHTAASYEEAAAGFSAGASHVTHLFNGMNEMLHREPGVAGAASERNDVAAEVICDGLHNHPAAVRLAFKMFPGRICLISDSLRCGGMPDGEYELGGQKVYLKGGAARLSDGTLAGASANLFDDLKSALRFGIPAEEAIMAATIIPAREIGISDMTGSIKEGKYADFVICDSEFRIKAVYLGGKKIPGGDE